MRIAIIGLTYPFRGGISHYTTLLGHALMKKHAVRVFSLKRQYPKLFFPGKSQLDHSRRPLRIPHTACLDPVNPISWVATFIAIRRYRPQLVLFSWWHLFCSPAYATVSYLVNRLARIPVCFLCHNVFPHEALPLDRMLLQGAFFKADAFITHNSGDTAALKSLCPHVAVYQGVHPTYRVFSENSPLSSKTAKAGLKVENKKVLLFFGFIRKYKGLTYLLEAMRSLQAQDGYHLIVAGEFYHSRRHYEPALRQLAQKGQLTLADQYISNEDLALYFKAADVVVLPYTEATQSGVVQIAYGFSVPVIATQVGGLPQAVFQDETGCLVPPADAPALAAVIKQYFALNQKKRFQKNIRRLDSVFSWDRLVHIIEDIHRNHRRNNR